MSSDKHSCVPGCKDSGGMHTVLHRFPNPEKDRFNTWLYSIGSDILGLENAHIFKYHRVCHIHFEDKHVCRNDRISNIAVPTLHLPENLQIDPAGIPVKFGSDRIRKNCATRAKPGRVASIRYGDI